MTNSSAFLDAGTVVTTEIGLLDLDQLAAISSIPGHPAVVAQGAGGVVSTRCARRAPVGGATRRLVTECGFTLRGSPDHQVVAIDAATGVRRWARLGGLAAGSVVPLRLGGFVGAPRSVPMPVLGQAYYSGDLGTTAPKTVTPELAEVVGYFMGDGSLHAKGLRLCVADEDSDVLNSLVAGVRGLFGGTPAVTQRVGYREVAIHSTRLVEWWEAAGFAKQLPSPSHRGKGWTPHVPPAFRESNCPDVYAAFLRGLFEADGTVIDGVPNVSTASAEFAGQIRCMLLGLGLLTTTRRTTSGFGRGIFQVRLRNLTYARRYLDVVGFMGARKTARVCTTGSTHAGKRDRIFLPRQQWRDLVPVSGPRRNLVLQSLRRYGSVPRELAESLYAEHPDPRLARALGDFYETVRGVSVEEPGAGCRVAAVSGASVVASGFLVR